MAADLEETQSEEEDAASACAPDLPLLPELALVGAIRSTFAPTPCAPFAAETGGRVGWLLQARTGCLIYSRSRTLKADPAKASIGVYIG